MPFDRAEQTLVQAQQKMATEAEWFQQVEQGIDTADFLGFEETAKKFGIERLHDVGPDQGIAHSVVAECGYALPGTVLRRDKAGAVG